jgi:hypothetical protein
MKKIIALTLVASSLAAASAFGQGYIQLVSGRTAVFDGFTTPGSGLSDTKVDVALFISSSTSAAPTVEGLANGTATSGTASFSTTTAWNDIVNDPNFALAVDQATSAGVVFATTTKGAATYSGGASFGIVGTGTSANYSFFEVSWDGALYATLAAAEAASSNPNDAIGWSPVVNNFGPLSGAVNTVYPIPTFSSFGTLLAATPEPGTLALAGLGGLSLLAFRRKK